MKKTLFSIMLAALLFSACQETKFRKVVNIQMDTTTRDVTITTQTGGDAIERTVGGAVLGHVLLGGKYGGIVGAGIGAATTDNPKFTTEKKTITEYTTTIFYDDGSKIVYRGINTQIKLGDSIPVNNSECPQMQN